MKKREPARLPTAVRREDLQALDRQVLAELGRHLGEPQLWQDLLDHLKQKHGRKRLIWERLRAEGCPI